MLRIMMALCVLVSLCSCIQEKRYPVWERLKQAEQEQKLWGEKLMQTVGTPLNGLILAWGKPEKIEARRYRWRKDDISQSGYYETVAPIRQTIRDKHGYAVGSIETPQEDRWVSSTSHYWCEVRVTTDTKGVITHAEFDTNNIICPDMFSLP